LGQNHGVGEQIFKIFGAALELAGILNFCLFRGFSDRLLADTNIRN